jgi:hypothetical protein
VSGFGRLDWVGVGGFLTGLSLFFRHFTGQWLGFEEEKSLRALQNLYSTIPYHTLSMAVMYAEVLVPLF